MRLTDTSTDIGVFVKGQWIDLKIRKHIKEINRKRYKKGLKTKISKPVIDKEEVVWNVTWVSTHHPHHTNKKNLNIIHKLRMRRSAIKAHHWQRRHTFPGEETEEADDLKCPLCLEEDEDLVHLLGGCQKTKEIREKALDKIYKIVDKASRKSGSLRVWAGEDCRQGSNLNWTPTKGVGQEGPKGGRQEQEEEERGVFP
jgi:hypothetical protein